MISDTTDQTSGMTLPIHCKPCRNGDGEKSGRNGQMRVLRLRVQKTPSLEKILQSKVSMERMGRKKSTATSSAWGWSMSEIRSIDLPQFHFGSGQCCTYCGQTPSERDHVIAVSYQTVRKSARFTGNGPWCWSCSECNRLLSNRYFDTFKDRCEWVQWRYESEAKPINWHEFELKPLGYGLQSHIKAEIQKRKKFRSQADFYGSRNFYLNIESLTWEIGSLHGKSIGNKFIASYFASILRDIVDGVNHPRNL